ncbi:Diphthamide synthase (EF-2-diphthine--ammonia ligase) [Roseivivax lentus]|uniref:Diphthamide synthase (EF-2-diphthine--ammonia ligase) n=1 Tax=Roseivivax lentus TaxID=633194 RepID=A0A1N7NHE9_9RHOB|nr:ATP-binding protein [Roseivivax lentus]SIS97774.1 Diphthamide synthase (EF-2-diphthine--ammonia ligase) [Roseivivax lentus]
MSAPRAVLSWSSGKDCAHALHVCRRDGLAEIEALFTTVTGAGRVAMHDTRAEILRAQAAALELPLIEVTLPWPCPNAEYERIMAAETAKLEAAGITHMVFGDLFLEDIRAYREAKLAGTGITPLFPIFGAPADTPRLAREMMESGLAARIATCDTSRLDAAFAGRTWDAALLAELPGTVDPCGENGEFHTIVTASPEFRAPLTLKHARTEIRDGYAYADLHPESATA